MIRLATPADAARVAAIYAPGIERTIASFEDTAPDAAEMARRITTTLPSYPWLVCDLPGAGVVGYAYAAPYHPRGGYRWSVTASVYVDDAFHRRGIGRGLYTSLFGLLRAQGFLNCYALIAVPNSGSVALHESQGFRLVGVFEGVGYKHGGWRDVGWYHLPLAPRPDVPAPPLDMATLTARPEWPGLLQAGEPLVRAE